jgi:hypothetical protein
MTSLPNAQAAKLDLRKLRHYCLNIDNPRGVHKARVLRAALGITAEEAEWFRGEILRLLPPAEATPATADSHGARFRVDLRITRHGREAVVRTAWIITPESTEPRFVSCWVL